MNETLKVKFRMHAFSGLEKISSNENYQISWGTAEHKPGRIFSEARKKIPLRGQFVLCLNFERNRAA